MSVQVFSSLLSVKGFTFLDSVQDLISGLDIPCYKKNVGLDTLLAG